MNFLLIAVCLLAGWVLRKTKILPQDSHKGINAWILYIAFPAVALHYIPTIPLNHELFIPILMPFVVWIGAWLTIKLFSRSFHFDAQTSGMLLLTAGIGNTSFAGFPLTQAYFGVDGLRIAVICDQLTFIILSTFGVITAVHASHGGSVVVGTIIKKLFRFPPFLSFIAAIVLPRLVDISVVDPLLERLSQTLVPLALFSVGMQIQFSEWKNERKIVAFGLAYKLMIAPLIVLSITLLLQVRGVVAQTSVFEASMAPGITAAIVAAQYNLNPKAANLMASFGIFVSFLTTFLWWFIVHALL